MATYFHGPNNQRETTPMIYNRESWPSSSTESPVISTNMMMYMNYLSSAGSCTNVMQPPQHGILPNPSGGGGHARMGEEENGFSSVWEHNRSEFPFVPPIGPATSLLQGVQSLQGQGLSLSLSSQIPPAIQIPSIEYQNLGPSSGPGFSFLSPINHPSIHDGENSSNKPMRGGEYNTQSSFASDPSPYGAQSVGRSLPNSKYLRAAQQLLEEVVNVSKVVKKGDPKKELARDGDGGGDGESKGEGKSVNEASSGQELKSNSPNDLSAAEKQDLQHKLSKLLSMLDEIDRRYKQYYHQMQVVVSSFDAVAGCGAAKPYTALALLTISRHFRCLRDAITGQIRAARKALGEQDSSDNVKGVKISRLRYVDQHLKQQRALQQLGMMQQHAWRPQRGLPESSVSILRAWLFEHFLHPYPKDSEKIMLARQTGLTRSQVSNWFINARVRLWKPMVEEMYKEETGDAEMDSESSPETGNKATIGDMNENRADQDLRQGATTSTDRCRNEQLPESKHALVSNTEMAGATHNLTHQSETSSRGELRPCLDDGGLFPGYQIFGSGNDVSLTLGLQHCEGHSLPISVDDQNFISMRGDAIYNAETPPVGPQTGDFDTDPDNRHHRYGSSHPLHDFVA